MAALAASGRVVSLGTRARAAVARQPGRSSPAPVVRHLRRRHRRLRRPGLARSSQRHRLPVTLYVATAFVDEGHPLSRRRPPGVVDGTGRRRAPPGWSTVGSHTHRHRLLDRLPAADVDDELDRSIELIGEHLGRDAARLRVPEGRPGFPGRRPGRALPVPLGGGRRHATQPVRTAPIRTPWPGRRSSAATGCGGSSARSTAGWRSRTTLRRVAEPAPLRRPPPRDRRPRRHGRPRDDHRHEPRAPPRSAARGVRHEPATT